MSPILANDEITKRVAELNVAWTAIGNDYLVRSFSTKDFNEGIRLVNTIAEVAEKLQHHPDVMLTYSQVEVRLSTHSVAGITEKDFTLAAALDDATK